MVGEDALIWVLILTIGPLYVLLLVGVAKFAWNIIATSEESGIMELKRQVELLRNGK